MSVMSQDFPVMDWGILISGKLQRILPETKNGGSIANIDPPFLVLCFVYTKVLLAAEQGRGTFVRFCPPVGTKTGASKNWGFVVISGTPAPKLGFNSNPFE